MQHSALYNLGFAAIICVACAIVVSSSAVALRDRQARNAALDRQRNVLLAAGLASDDETLEPADIEQRFEPIQPVVIDLATGEPAPEVDVASFDQREASVDPTRSREAPPNASQINRLPEHALVYQLRDEAGGLETLVLPVEGLGLWGTLYGFLALDADLETIKGLTFYEHKETPGLGGEVDNPRWKALWPGRKAFDDTWSPAIEVIKGPAGPPEEDPYEVDGLSGASLTSRGVTNLLQFWLGDDGFGPYLRRIREQRSGV